MFCAKQSQSRSLPPCQDGLNKHTLCANYQAAIWRNALHANPHIPSPESHGWRLQDDVLTVDWMSLPHAPEALMELVICGCIGQCSSNHCTCRRNGLSCSNSCQCGDSCENPYNYQCEEEGDDDDDDDDDASADIDDET